VYVYAGAGEDTKPGGGGPAKPEAEAATATAPQLCPAVVTSTVLGSRPCVSEQHRGWYQREAGTLRDAVLAPLSLSATSCPQRSSSLSLSLALCLSRGCVSSTRMISESSPARESGT
jgi:hypothetical protein